MSIKLKILWQTLVHPLLIRETKTNGFYIIKKGKNKYVRALRRNDGRVLHFVSKDLKMITRKQNN